MTLLNEILVVKEDTIVSLTLLSFMVLFLFTLCVGVVAGYIMGRSDGTK